MTNHLAPNQHTVGELLSQRKQQCNVVLNDAQLLKAERSLRSSRRKAPARSALESRARILFSACVAAVMNGAISGTAVASTHQIVTERQVLLDVVDGGARVISQTSDGGFVVAGATAMAWLVRTDSNGKIIWTYNDEKKSTGPTDKVRPHFNGVSRAETEPAKISVSGEVVARKSIQGGNSGFRLYLVTRVGTTKVGVYTANTDFVVHTFDAHLFETGAPQSVRGFDVQQGRALVLADESLALFGRDSRPTVVWMGPTGTPLAVQAFPLTGGYSIPDAVHISDRQFVFIQDSQNPRGVLMRWVTFG